VAQGYGVGFWAVAEWGYHEFVIAEAGLDEVERVEGIRDRMRALYQAQLAAHAMWSPEGLATERAAIQRTMRQHAPAIDTERAAALDDAMGVLERAARRKRRPDGS
jgi:hypothetical protein